MQKLHISSRTKKKSSIARGDKPRTRCIIECFIKIKHAYETILKITPRHNKCESQTVGQKWFRGSCEMITSSRSNGFSVFFSGILHVAWVRKLFRHARESIFCWSFWQLVTRWLRELFLFNYGVMRLPQLDMRKPFTLRLHKCKILKRERQSVAMIWFLTMVSFLMIHPQIENTSRSNSIHIEHMKIYWNIMESGSKSSLIAISNYIRVRWHCSNNSYSFWKLRSD